MDTGQVGTAFPILKPVLNQIIKQPSKTHITKLKELICKISPSALQALQDFILFPIEVQLMNQQIGSEEKRQLVDCMKDVLQHTHFHDFKKLLEFYTLLFFQIYDQQRVDLVGDVPEELKLSVVECVTTLLKQASSDVVGELYNKKHVPKLGQGIYICVQLAQWEKLRQLRIAAIECIMTLAQVHGDADRDDTVFRHQVGDVIMFFLPGIVSGMQRIATEDEKQGHQITLLAVRAWGEAIALVMEDSPAPDAPQHIEMQLNMNPPLAVSKEDPLTHKWENNRETMLKDLQEKSRTPEWYRAAAEKLAVSTKALSVVQQHSHWKVRQQLASTCQTLLSRCSRNMYPSVMHLVEMLIMLSEDESEKVAAVSKSALDSYSKRCEMEGGKSLLEILEENFYSLVSKLPRILHGTDDVQQLAAMRLLAGYINLLGAKKLPHLLRSAAHLNRLVWTLIQAFEFDTSGVSLLEDFGVRDLETNHVVRDTVPWKKFKHFTDNNVLKKMEDVCYLLGQYGDLNILSYHLLDLFNTSPNHRKEIIFLLNEIVCRGVQRGDSSVDHIVEDVLQAYLEPSAWYTCLTAGSYISDLGEELNISIGEVQSNVIQSCLLVEGVGKMALVLGPNFDQFLLRTLYAVLERAGSVNGLVAEAGMSAVQDISDAGGHGRDVTELVRANADYFSYHVTTKLRKMQQYPGVMDVLQVVMRYSSMDVLPCLEDIVKDVLMQSCDAFQDRNVISFLRVFHTFVVSVRQWLRSGKIQSDVSESCAASDIVDDLVEYHRCKRKVQDFSEGGDEGSESVPEVPDSGDDMNCDTENSDEKKEKLPLHVELTVSVLKRCLHFLPTRKREQKLLVLSILKEGLHILEVWENELLPIVHAIWSPFVNRFAETSDPLVVNRSFALLCVMAQTAKDFIRARTLKQVLQPLCDTLSKSAPESRKKDKGSAYRFTQLFKLQLQLLSELGDLVINLNLQERQLDQVMTAAAPYLSSLQPRPLQESCVKLFKKLSTVNQDAVWLKVISMWSPVQWLRPPFNELHIIKFSDRNTHHQEEFKKNAEDILSSFCWLSKE
ncbi:TELO2-interacting protein 1 homolog isoform X2 [Periplaneta americana]